MAKAAVWAPPVSGTTTAESAARYSTTQEFAERVRGFSLPTPWFQEAWYEALDDPGKKRILLLCPREHGKTSVVLSFVLHNFWRDRSVRQVLISQTQPLAKRFMRDVKTSLLLPPFGPDWRGEPWGAQELSLAGTNHGKDVSLFCVGATGQITGAHADVLIFDDVESAKTVRSEERRAATKEWFAKEAEPVISAGGRAVVVGTRKHWDDLYESLLTEGSEWTVLDNALRAIDKDTGRPIWPERWPLDALMARKALLDQVDLRAWSQEYENDPIPSLTQMFNPVKWPTYQRLPDGLQYYQAWDFALSEKTSADPSACITAGVDSQENVYLIAAEVGHYGVGKLAEKIDATCFESPHRIRQVFYEKTGFQSPIMRELLQKVRAPMRGLPVVGDKELHARRAEAKAANGGIVRPAALTPWWGALAAEFARFPAGAHDDQVDALSYLIDGALPPKGRSAAPASIGTRTSPWRFGRI